MIRYSIPSNVSLKKGKKEAISFFLGSLGGFDWIHVVGWEEPRENFFGEQEAKLALCDWVTLLFITFKQTNDICFYTIRPLVIGSIALCRSVY